MKPTLLLLSFFSATLFAINEPAAHYEFKYQMHIDLPKKKMPIKLWLPYPTEDQFQTVNNRKIESSKLPWTLTREKQFGNQILYFDGTSKRKSVDVTVTYDVTRQMDNGIPIAKSDAGTKEDPARYLKEDKKILFAPKIKEIAAKESKPEQTDKEKIRTFYDYVVRTMSVDKSGTGWGQGDAVWACDSKRGNCTDFHSLFIALNRVSGIPARFFIGFPIPSDKAESEIPGYHCWAEAYSSASGWIPVDASEAKKTGKPEMYFGHLPPNRIAFAAGRDLILEPPQKGEPLNFFIYPYAEIDGKPMKDGIKTGFWFKRL